MHVRVSCCAWCEHCADTCGVWGLLHCRDDWQWCSAHCVRFVTGSLDGTIIIWSSETLQKLHALNVKTVYVPTTVLSVLPIGHVYTLVGKAASHRVLLQHKCVLGSNCPPSAALRATPFLLLSAPPPFCLWGAMVHAAACPVGIIL